VAYIVLGTGLLRWSTDGYAERVDRPSRGAATLITPPSLVEVLRSGWEGVVPLVHPSAATAPPSVR
ncbi:MAG: hypothetical protein WB297_02725, partial [Actinomycetota bacterium]